jgi:hypothetical protein
MDKILIRQNIKLPNYTEHRIHSLVYPKASIVVKALNLNI